MTDYADPEEVVLYDLDLTESVDDLIALSRDPERRWYARRRMAALAQQGITAAVGWDPKLHPRGKDGKFIQIWGLVRWLGSDGKWRRGQVIEIDQANGDISVKRVAPSGIPADDPVIEVFKTHQASKLTSMPNPKAKLDLPDPTKSDNDLKWQKIGGQGGSNPGGKYKADALYGDVGDSDFISFKHIVEQNGLTLGLGSPAVGRVHGGMGTTAKVLYRDDDGKITAANGMPYNPPPDVDWYSSFDTAAVDKAWSEVKASASSVSAGDEWYVKKAKSPDHAKIEVLANRLYEAAGVNVPSTQLGIDPGFLASKIQTDVVSTKEDLGDRLNDPEILSKVRADFIVDAWLANWDAVGLDYENIQIIDDTPYRIDAGGALTYRAQGAPKGTMFGPTVGEVDSLLDPSINAQAAKVFGSLTGDETADGLERIAAISPEGIKAMVAEMGVDDSVADTLIARRHYLLNVWASVEDPWAEDVPESGIDVAVPTPEVTPGSTGIHHWDTVNKQWTKSPALSPASSADGLSKLYNSPLLFQVTPALELHSSGDTRYIIYGGRLVVAKPIQPSGLFSIKDIIDGSEADIAPNPLMPLYVMSGDPTSTIETYTALMGILRGSSVSQDANRTLSDLFDAPGLSQTFPGPGEPEIPKFRSQGLYSDEPVAPGQYVYDSVKMKLYRATVGKSNLGDSIAVTDVDTGAQTVVNYGGLYTPVTDDHGYSVEVLNAVVEDGENAKLEALLAEEEAIENAAKQYHAGTKSLYTELTGVEDPTDAELVEWVDGPQVEDVPPTAMIPYTAAWKAHQLATGQSMTPNEAVTADLKFIAEFGAYNEGVTIQKSKLDAFADLNGIPPGPINDYLNGVIGGSPDPGVEEPDPPSKQDVNTPASYYDNVSPALHATPVTWDAATAEKFVGKVLFLKSPELPENDEGVVQLKHSYYNKTVAYLVYVDSVDADGTLHMISPDGRPTKANTALLDLDIYEIDNVTGQDFKLSKKPTMKGNGDIVHGGVVIGKWEKVSYWNDEYKYTIFGEHSTLGKTTTATLSKKSDMATWVTTMALPKPITVKTKKASTGSKKIAAAVAEIPELKGATFSDGSTAKLGDWVQSTKGGGGFVGKIVGWPNQEYAPGLVFAVDKKGIQKAVKLKTQKKVSEPPGGDPSVGAAPIIDNVPSAYTGLSLSDGNVPVIGMKVEAGKPGGAKTEGIITNINPSQGWVYILTPDGKTVSKTFSVTKVTDAPPDLVWDLPDAAVIAAKVTKPKAAPGQVLYPSESGLLYSQNDSVREAWLAGNPQRKLTKDGYAPEIGLRIRTSKGEEAVIYELPDEWSPSAVNSVKIYNLATQKTSSTSISTASVDHEAELVGPGGKPVASVNSLQLGESIESFPDGTPIYRMGVSVSMWSNSKHRTFKDWVYFIQTGDDSIKVVYAPTWQGHEQPELNATSFKWGVAKNYSPTALEKVAVIDNSAPVALKIAPHKKSGPYNEQVFHHSNTELVDHEGGKVIVPQPETNPTPDPVEEILTEVGLPEPEPVAVPDTTPSPEPETPGETPAVIDPPAVVSQMSITDLIPPPSVKKVKQAKDPAIPVITAPEPVDLSQQNALLGGAGANSIEAAATKMIALKDSTAPGSGSVYALGDSDVIEDMALRYNVEVVEGQERLVLRFRLREDLSEEALGKVVTTGEAQTGAWKIHSSVFPHQLEPGDALSVRIASGSKLMKPTEGSPNARVVGEPKLLGKTDESGFDVYRITVQTDDGAIGEVDMQHRPSASINTYEWDPDAIPENTGKALKLTPTAAEAGWQRLGAMSMPGSHGSILVDKAGKFDAQGMVQGGMAKGSGGHWLRRKLPNGGYVTLNAAHTTESGIGFDTARRANIAGEVRISVPIEDDQPIESVMSSISRAMELVGVTPEKQAPPSDEHMLRFSLQKFVTNYHPEYKYRDKLISGPDDPKVTETLAHMNSKLGKHLGREMTLDDIRLHTHKNGRVQVVLSPEVAIAMGKLQGNHHFQHAGASHLGFEIFGSAINGVMGADERWSLGVMNQSMSGYADQTIGSGDRIYMRGNHGKSVPGGMVVFSPLMINSGTEVYTNKNNDSDSYGRRGSSNKFMETGAGPEVMYKRKIEPEMISYYIATSSGNRDDILAKLKAAGVTHINGRPIEDIILTSEQFAKLGDISTVGIDFWKDDIPITQLVGPTVSVPIAAGGST